VSALCLTSRPFATSEKSTVSSTRPVNAGFTAAAAIHVGRTRGVEAAGSDGDSVAADGTDDAMLSEAVAEFYTDQKQDSSGTVKVFTHRYSTLLSPVHMTSLTSPHLISARLVCPHFISF